MFENFHGNNVAFGSWKFACVVCLRTCIKYRLSNLVVMQRFVWRSLGGDIFFLNASMSSIKERVSRL